MYRATMFTKFTIVTYFHIVLTLGYTFLIGTLNVMNFMIPFSYRYTKGDTIYNPIYSNIYFKI